METSEVKKAAKPAAKKSNATTIRVSQETRKKLLAELTKVNKKQSGRYIKLDALIVKLLPKLTAQDVSELQEASLTGRDRLEKNYRAYCAKFGEITMDEFLLRLSEHAMSQTTSENAAKS